MLNNKSGYLYEVVMIRVVLVFLLVLYHSFIIYCGGWQEPVGFVNIPSYWWIGKGAYSIMLESFVFISGYVFGIQMIEKKRYIETFARGALN